MLIEDRIYGKIDINEEVIIDLINTPIFQRLKRISQDGASHFIQPVRKGNRFEHSIGVWNLSKFYNGSIEEQVACLLHDLSHTAFSHVIDFVVEHPKHEYADDKLKAMIYKSEIPEIIKSHNLDLEKILDKTKYPLLDNNLPDISVDRLDYFMRDGFMIGFIPTVLVNEFAQNIFKKNDTLFFRDVRLASTFAILFVNFSRLIWLDPTSHGAFYLLANAIKLAIADGLITEEDFFTDDETMLKTLKKSNNPKINNLLNRLVPGKEFIYVKKEDADFYGSNKPRFVDPLVEINAELVRVSKIVPSLKYFFEEFVQKYTMLGVKQI